MKKGFEGGSVFCKTENSECGSFFKKNENCLSKNRIFLIILLGCIVFIMFMTCSVYAYDCSLLKNEKDIINFVKNISADSEIGDTVVLPSVSRGVGAGVGSNFTIDIISLRENKTICSLSFNLSRLGEFKTIVPQDPRIILMHSVSADSPVHQWIDYQSQFLWTKPEFASYLPSSWTSNINNLNSYQITYGVKMEDDEITTDILCWNHPMCNHFWGDPHLKTSSGLYLYKQWNSAYSRAQNIWDTEVIPYYKLGDKEEAYYWLGRVSHLLGDMGVPAHVHLDSHLYVDSYESYVKDNTLNANGNFLQWSASGNYTKKDSLYDLFYDMAEMSDNYESNGANGESALQYEGHNGACEIQITSPGKLWGCYDVSYAEAKIHGNVLMPETERHIADLYRLFWIQTHNLNSCSSGECCDNSLGITIENGSQPRGYSDYNFCNGNSIYKRDYYCPGVSNTASYTNSFVQVCSGNQQCSNGECKTVICNQNSNCGINGFVGGLFCQGNSVSQNYITYSCKNPGSVNSYCTNLTQLQLRQSCSSNQVCSNGVCGNCIKLCLRNSDCGNNGFVDSIFCKDGNVFQNYVNYTCKNAGTCNAYCSYSSSALLKQKCGSSQQCSNGNCVNISCGFDRYVGNTFCMDNSSKIYLNYLSYFYDKNNSVCNNSTVVRDIQDCGTNSCDVFGKNYCNNGSVYHNHTCYIRGCFNGGCFTNNYLNETLVQSCNVGCVNGACITKEDCTKKTLAYSCSWGYSVQNSYKCSSGQGTNTYCNIGKCIADASGNKMNYCSKGCNGKTGMCN